MASDLRGRYRRFHERLTGVIDDLTLQPILTFALYCARISAGFGILIDDYQRRTGVTSLTNVASVEDLKRLFRGEIVR